uniref:Cytoskeleton-associated protein 5 n=1 Tax=Lygus hesperus TaxID=30085 RepID=A0A0A9YXT8_LYGHE
MEEEEQFNKLSVEERCVHKSWKARVSGYEAAAKLFRTIDDEKSPEWNKYLGLVKKFVVDSNAPAQEKGLDAVLAFVENCNAAGKTVNDVMSGVIQKCIAAPKARTKELGAQICLMYIEIEKHELALEELFKGTESKNPKISAASVHIITDALREFGPKVINVNKLIKRAMPLLEDRDKGVRDETKQLLIEMYRWLGEALTPQLSSLKPAQLNEMTAEFAKMEASRPKPTRFLRSQQAKQSQIVAEREEEADEGDGEDVGGEAIDPFDLMDPVDILSQLPKGFYEQLEAKKWSERKEALDALEKSLNDAPKIENADYGDLIRALKKIIQKDSNVVVVCVAIKCVTGIAKGLKKRFHTYAVVTMQALFEKFKEKKQNVVLALRDAVDTVFVSITLEAILEDVIANLDNKNPSIKSEVAGFLARCLTKTTPVMLNNNKKAMLKALVKALLKSLVDQDPNVRENAALALGTAMKVVGEKVMLPLLTDVDNQKMAKIKESHDNAVILVKAPKPAKAKEPSPAPIQEKPSGAKIVKPKNIVKKKATTGGGLAAKEAIAKAKSLIPDNILSKLDGNNEAAWSEYLKFVEQLDVSGESGEITFAVTCTIPSEEASSDVLAIKLNVLKAITNKMSVSKSTLDNAIPDVLFALTNKDCAESASAVLNNFANMTSVDQVVRSALTDEIVLNNPKLWAEALNWTTSSIMKSGVIGDAAFLEECGKNALHQCDLVRNAGLALIGTLHLPPRGSDSSSTRKEKVLRSSSAPKVNETLKADRVVEESSSEKEIVPKSQNEPRVDIGNQITEQTMKDLVDKTWKVRAEVVTKLQGIVNSNPNITGNLGDAPPLIAARIKDGNTSIATSAIALVESLAKAMGPFFKIHVKVFLPPLLKSIGDSKTWIKTPALSCINTIGETSGYKEFFENEMIADALKTGSPATRAELWIWLAEKLPNIPVKMIQKEELSVCLPTLYNNLEDRNAEVRKGANDAVLGFMIHLGYSSMNSACDNIVKGSNAAAIKAILDKTRGLLPEKPVTKSKSQPIIEKGSKSASVAKMAPGSSATVTKPKVKPGSAPPSRTGRKKEEDVDASALLKINSLKHQRAIDEQKLKIMKWNFTTPRQEFVDLLRDQMTAANCNKNLIANMFHTDFKYHLKAIDSLMDELPSNVPGLICNLDLVLRWMTLRFFDTNPSVITRGLDYLSHAFTAVQNDNYVMLDSEANSFLPYLVLKSGDPKDIVQQKVKELFEQLKNIYPVGKLVQAVMEGTKSKNARQRAACLDVLNNYIEVYGVSVCNPSLNVFVKDIVKHFADRDSAVRNSAMKLAVSMYSHEGERFIQLMNQYTEKDGQLLEERIRKGARNRPVASVKPMARENVEIVEEDAAPVEEDYPEQEEAFEPHPEPFHPQPTPTIPRSTCALRNTNTSLSSANYLFDEHVIEEIESGAMPTHQALIPPKLTDIDLHFMSEGSVQSSIKPIQMSKITPTLSNFAQPTAIKWELAQIASSDIEKAMNSMTQIDTVLNSEKRCSLIMFVDYMVQQLVHQLLILNQSHHPEVVNCYRANFAMLTKVCSYQELCIQITETTLYRVLEQLLSLLAESKLEALDRQDMFRRVVNNIVLKLLENANKTYLMCALINMLGKTVDIPLASGHYNDLCIRCLWKLNRAQPKWDKELNYTRILQEYQKFLKDYPSAWWKSQEVDVPLRTVKTMLHTMVKLRGTKVRDCINNDPSIPDDSELSLYVRKLVKHLKLEEIKDSSKSFNSEECEKQKIDKPPRLTKEHSNELSEIFKMIGDTAETSEGLKRLHSFIKAHPEADIQPFVAKASPVFQNYIRRGLSDLDDQCKRKTDTSFNGSMKNEEDGDDSQHSDEKKKFDTDAERLWNRLTALQEKAGCHDSAKKPEKVDISKDSEILKEDPRPNEELDTIRERYNRIKSHLFK